MKTITKIPLFLTIILVIIACENEPLDLGENPQEIIDPEPTPPETSIDLSDNFGNEINRDFLGQVKDENHQPLENVAIKIGTTTTTTDQNGVFIIKNASIHERFAYVTAKKNGYFPGSRALVPTDGTNKVTIMLLEENLIKTIQSGINETISLPDNTSLSLTGNYITESGEEYNGNVRVYLQRLNPTEEDMRYQMPGMLYAANSENQERLLQSYGMLAVELKGDNNEELNLAEGTTAEIKIPLDTELMNSAPSSIPLWHFNEEKGYWIEEGQASLEGNTYVGEVSHFSFWNYDADFPAVNLCITLTDSNGNPIANQSITLTHNNSTYLFPTTVGYTNQNGEVCGLIPSNESLEINVYQADFCNTTTPIYNANIGPYASNSNETVSITNTSDVLTENISGTFSNCNNSPVTNGYVKLTYENQNYIDIVSNGNFDINLTRCSNNNNNFSVEGFDYDNQQTTGEINYTFSTSQTNLGTLISCNNTQELIQYSIDGGSQEFIAISDIQVSFEAINQNYNAPYLSISASSSQNCFYMFGILNSNQYTGTYDYYDWNISDDTGFNLTECTSISETNNDIIFNITNLGNVGEYIDINFNGNYEDYQGNQHSITGIIHVLRDE
ncbi:Ig-like domain-containing protein [Mesonia aquimarina]|uniref:Ig-like domain-containing protein n=1 Tax=Mesonia aquimarina TaxID=1504967 RepID=UPI000EF56296|nr:Ig-like domain-containing protein [Mesonia aquimarina]